MNIKLGHKIGTFTGLNCAEQDPYAKDADKVIERAKSQDNITHHRDDGTHPMTPERFQKIIDFIVEQGKA